MTVRNQPKAKRAAFTLVELMVVVAILVVLIGAAVPIYMKYLDDAKKDRVRMDLRTLTQAVQMYQVKYGEFPASLELLTQSVDGGLPALEASALLDPWGRQYQYAAEGPHNAHLAKPDIWSTGPKLNDPNGIIGNWSTQ